MVVCSCVYSELSNWYDSNTQTEVRHNDDTFIYKEVTAALHSINPSSNQNSFLIYLSGAGNNSDLELELIMNEIEPEVFFDTLGIDIFGYGRYYFDAGVTVKWDTVWFDGWNYSGKAIIDFNKMLSPADFSSIFPKQSFSIDFFQ